MSQALTVVPAVDSADSSFLLTISLLLQHTHFLLHVTSNVSAPKQVTMHPCDEDADSIPNPSRAAAYLHGIKQQVSSHASRVKLF